MWEGLVNVYIILTVAVSWKLRTPPTGELDRVFQSREVN
jgi:hypothetical protein